MKLSWKWCNPSCAVVAFSDFLFWIHRLYASVHTYWKLSKCSSYILLFCYFFFKLGLYSLFLTIQIGKSQHPNQAKYKTSKCPNLILKPPVIGQFSPLHPNALKTTWRSLQVKSAGMNNNFLSCILYLTSLHLNADLLVPLLWQQQFSIFVPKF